MNIESVTRELITTSAGVLKLNLSPTQLEQIVANCLAKLGDQAPHKALPSIVQQELKLFNRG